MSSTKRLRIDIVEDPSAPAHRRWAGTVELPDGRSGRVHAAVWSELWECVEEGVFVDRSCQAPGCREQCTAMDRCMGCGAVVCPICNVDLDVLTPHRPDVHWRAQPDLELRRDPMRETWAEPVRDATRLLANVHDPRRLLLGAEALRVAREFIPDEHFVTPLRTSTASVLVFVERVLERPDTPRLRAQLSAALERLRCELERVAGGGE